MGGREYLIANNPHYHGCQQDVSKLNALPKHGSTASRLCQVILQEEPPPTRAFPKRNTRAPTAENQVEESYLGRPKQPNELQREVLLELLREQFGVGKEQPAESSMTTTHPGFKGTLFPTGEGNVTKKDH